MKTCQINRDSVEPGLVSKQAIASLVEYMVMEAINLDTDIILEKLRTLARCWKDHRDQIRKTTAIINDIKSKTGNGEFKVSHR